MLERLRLLWTQPVEDHGDAEAAFRKVYADPVVVNGIQMPVTALVDRASALQRASFDVTASGTFADLMASRIEIGLRSCVSVWGLVASAPWTSTRCGRRLRAAPGGFT